MSDWRRPRWTRNAAWTGMRRRHWPVGAARSRPRAGWTGHAAPATELDRVVVTATRQPDDA